MHDWEIPVWYTGTSKKQTRYLVILLEGFTQQGCWVHTQILFTPKGFVSVYGPMVNYSKRELLKVEQVQNCLIKLCAAEFRSKTFEEYLGWWTCIHLSQFLEDVLSLPFKQFNEKRVRKMPNTKTPMLRRRIGGANLNSTEREDF